MRRFTLRLTLDVTYDITDETDIQELRNNILDLPTMAMRHGILTDGTDAEVVVANPRLEQVGEEDGCGCLQGQCCPVCDPDTYVQQATSKLALLNKLEKA